MRLQPNHNVQRQYNQDTRKLSTILFAELCVESPRRLYRRIEQAEEPYRQSGPSPPFQSQIHFQTRTTKTSTYQYGSTSDYHQLPCHCTSISSSSKLVRNHSPNRSHIPQTQESGLDVERITSSSKPDPETDHPKPNTLDEDSGNGLESEDDQEDLSNETLGDLNLSALDDLESRFDTSQSPERQRLNNRSSRTRNTSPAVQAQPQLILITFNLTFHHIAPSVAYSSSQIRSCCQ
ncbi:hypothetical protein PCASD_12128 [Puccinia coronata f. sp. avenae]|uniref:Uncharacterized protein n=1 Tax=Puccinia coronata f. sp. avenae TaxID=200324 RepID=A0A2N5UDR7_9BASI|nr:hypothetical protein PCASD_12128 [Puccinia coronata f. sp. avenae]